MSEKYHDIWGTMQREHPQEIATFADAIAQLETYASRCDETGDIAPSVWSQAPASFFNRMLLPLRYGGLSIAAKSLYRTVLYERAGRMGAGLAIALPGPGLSMPPVACLGTESQQSHFASYFTETKLPVWGAFAISEPHCGSDAKSLRTTASREGNGYRIHGSKCFVTNGARADILVVFANTNPRQGFFGIRAFLVPKATPGLTIDRTENMLGLRPSQLANISLNHVWVPVDAMLGYDGQKGPVIDGLTAAQKSWDSMRPCLSAMIAGYCFHALEKARVELPEDTRDDLNVFHWKLRAVQLLAQRAAWKHDQGQDCALDASMAKASAAKVSMELAHYLLDQLGPCGWQLHSFWERFYRDCKAFDILEGTGDMQRLMIARSYPQQAARGE